MLKRCYKAYANTKSYWEIFYVILSTWVRLVNGHTSNIWEMHSCNIRGISKQVIYIVHLPYQVHGFQKCMRRDHHCSKLIQIWTRHQWISVTGAITFTCTFWCFGRSQRSTLTQWLLPVSVPIHDWRIHTSRKSVFNQCMGADWGAQ